MCLLEKEESRRIQGSQKFSIRLKFVRNRNPQFIFLANMLHWEPQPKQTQQFSIDLRFVWQITRISNRQVSLRKIRQGR